MAGDSEANDENHVSNDYAENYDYSVDASYRDESVTEITSNDSRQFTDARAFTDASEFSDSRAYTDASEFSDSREYTDSRAYTDASEFSDSRAYTDQSVRTTNVLDGGAVDAVEGVALGSLSYGENVLAEGFGFGRDVAEIGERQTLAAMDSANAAAILAAEGISNAATRALQSFERVNSRTLDFATTTLAEYDGTFGESLEGTRGSFRDALLFSANQAGYQEAKEKESAGLLSPAAMGGLAIAAIALPAIYKAMK